MLTLARACKNAGVATGLSSFATKSLEEVAEASKSVPNVLQLYLFEEREHSQNLLRRAKQAGYKAVFLTVPPPFLGRRNLEIRNQFKLPPHLKIANFAGEGLQDGIDKPGNNDEKTSRPKLGRQKSEAGYLEGGKRVLPKGPVTFRTHAANPALSWEREIEWLKKECEPDVQVWVKGIASAEDAELAVKYVISGIVVSNHGDRQLNGALATLDALPEVVEVLKGRIPVHADGGIRHVTDVFKALALGADFAWVGRPALWGLAYNGSDGVELMTRLLADEIKVCMALAGTVKVSDTTKDSLVKVDKSGFVARL
ncbi:hydroxyacid oxidase 1 [Acrodontium crateriforme]|uniref:Hydroxyacid oxidase 1 n=1 Tax=Acrodontium crateriforme TaxID=150365 RepID=A0AAQ3M0C8_9PEZI|nr:hydroxyacid oxidase 1 [Acrodontium crateriforme]